MVTTHSIHSGQRVRWLPGIAMLVAILATSFPEKTARAADGFSLSYAGRLTQSSGAPVEGPVDIELRFYPSETEGSPLADPYTFTNVTLQNGMFALSVQLTTKDAQTVLGTGSEPVFVEVTAAGRVYPRQRFSFVPYALRIPVDDSSLVYDKTSGKLSINGSGTATLGQLLTSDGNGKVRWDKLSSVSLSAQTATGDQPGEDQILTYKSGKWVAGNLVDIPSSFGSVTSVTAAPPLTVTTPSTTPALSITQASGTTGGYLSSADWTAFHSKQAAGNYLTELTGDLVATGPGSGSASLAPIALPGTATKITFDAKGRVTSGTSLTAADVSGALGYEPLGYVSIQTGTGLTGGPITTSGTVTLADTAVTPGTYLRANIVVDAQGRLTQAESAPLVSDADIAAGAAISQSKIQGLVSDLSSKEPALPTGGGSAQFLTGTKTWQSLNTALVTEGQANLYYTDERARDAITATPPLNYFAATGKMTMSKAEATADGYLSSGDWVTFNAKQDALGFTPLNKAGDSISGTMNFSGNDLLAVGNIQIEAAKTLGLGIYDSDPTGLTAADKGKTWFNASDNQMKYWDGTATQVVGAVGAALASLNGQSGPSQSFGSPGSSGTAPAWSSNSNVHTLNIPMAAAGDVTAGLLSNSDYAKFNAKQPAGSYLTQLAGDITSSGFSAGTVTTTLQSVVLPATSTKVTYDAKGRVTSGTSLAAADLPAHSASLIASGTVALAYGGTGTNLSATGGAGQYLKQVTAGGAVTVGTLASADVTNALGYTPTNKAGDTMSGALAMGGNDITNVGNVQIAAAKTLGLGVYSADPAGLSVADKGKTWFNSGANQMKYWDGTSVQVVGAVGAAVASLNNQTGATQSFGVPGTSGTVPAWSSAGNVHTLNIPMASANGVTAGLLANSDYATFSAKQPAGNYITAITGDVTASGPGSITATLATVATAGTYTKVNIDTKGRVLSGTTLVSSDITDTLGFTPLNRAGDTATGKLEMASAVITGNVGVGTTLPHSRLQVSGSVATAITVRSANSTLTSNDSIVLANASSSPFTITLPSASGITGRTYSIKKSDSTTNVVTINATGAELIDGAASVSLANPYQTLQLASDGANWSRIGGEAWGHTGADVWRQQGNVGVGTSSPSTKLDVNGLVKIQGGSPGVGKVLTSDSVGLASWTTPAVGTITGVTAGSGLTGGGGSGAISLAVDAGTTANKIVRLDAAAALPAVDGAALINLSPTNLGTVVPLGKGGTGSSLLLTGGSGQYLKQTASGANVSVGSIAVGDLPTLVGDTGSGGTAGIVPAPAGGDSTAGKYLKADGSWSVPPGITNWSAPGTIGATTPNSGSFTYLLASGNVGIGTNTARATLDLGARTDALALPTGTTAQQPSSPQAGWIRHNTTTTLLEYFNGTAWMPATNAVSPAGMIAPFPTSTCPTGWLEADGAAVSRTTYNALFTALGTSYGAGNGTTTFHLPDYRGYFMRGWSHGSGNDPDAGSRTNRGDGTTADNVGSRQNDAFQDHTHATYATDDGGRNDSTTAQGGQTYLQGGYATQGANSGRSASETRPKNIYVTYCVSTQLLPTTTVASTGSGAASYVPQWTSSTALGNSPIVINNGNVGIGSNTPAKALDIGSGSVRAGGFERSDGTPLYSGDIYTRWGNATAPAGTELLYSGFAYSAFYNHSGSGDMTCFKTNGTAGTVAHSYGDLLYAADVHHLHNDGVPAHTMVKCAVYYSPRPRAIIWGDNTCPANWTLSYHGYAIGSYYTHPAPMERICLDVQNIDSSVNVTGAKAHMYATNLYQGFAELGNPPTNRNLRCAVCQKN